MEVLPHVILHNSLSVDRWTEGFTPDIGLHQEIASRWKIDATLAGSNTIFNAEDELPEENEQAFEIPNNEPDVQRSLLVVLDRWRGV